MITSLETPPQRESRKLMTLAAWVYGGMTAIALVWGTARGLTDAWWLHDSVTSIGTALLLGLAVGGGGIAVTRLLEHVADGVRALGERFGHILRHAGPKEAVLLALFSSVGEEMLFRGCLQEEFGLWPATVAFALAHVGREPVYLWWTASALVFGLGLGLLYQGQGGLLAPIAMHFIINAVNINILARRARSRRPGTG